MEILVWLFICAFAAFRFSEMLVIDDGPFDVFISLRGWFSAAPDESKSLRRTIANGLTCVHCVGIWISFLLAFTFPVSVFGILKFLIVWFAISGLQSIFACRFGRSQ